MLFLSDIFDDYQQLATLNNHKIDIKNFNAIFQLIPNEFKKSIIGRSDECTIRPSIGKGIVTDIPWVYIMNKNITPSPNPDIISHCYFLMTCRNVIYH